MAKKLFLLDGHALVYRAHFAFINRPLINSKGLDTSAIAGFVRALWDLMRTQHPTHIAVAFDPDGPTFRKEMYQEYKANRAEQPEAIGIAFPIIKEIVRAFHIPIITVDNYEADDVIGTIAKQAEKEGFQVFMVTPDKDYAQLVSENIFMYKPSRMGNGVAILGVPEVQEKFCIERPEQVIDVLALQGDTSDNIPGVPGIGPKTACKLLDQFGSLEEILAQKDTIKGKNRERLTEFEEQALLSKRLATIDLKVPIKFDADAYIIDPFDREKLTVLFKDLEFRALANAILGDTNPGTTTKGAQGNLFADPNHSPRPAQSGKFALPEHAIADKNLATIEHTYHLVDTPEERANLIKILEKQSMFCFDLETTSIDPNLAEPVGVAFSIQKGEAYYVPLAEDQEIAHEQLNQFKALFENEKIEKTGQNIKYDIIVLKWYDIEVKGKLWDTMLAHYLLEPELRHNMDYLAETYLSYKPQSIVELIGKKGKNQLTMRDVPVEKVVEYAGEDADITLQLREVLEPKLKEEGLEELFYTLEMPLVPVLVEMEYNGINIDADYLHNYSEELGQLIDTIEDEIYDEAGKPFNIGSPKQVGTLLFDDMEIPYRGSKTKTGQYSTNEAKLRDLAGDYPFVEKILRYRGLTKLRSTYVDALPKLVNPRSGRIHSSFNQSLVATGRLSSSNPNLQNIPVRTPEGAKVREAFIPRDEDHILLAADYSQIELRLIAEISGDKAMLDAFQNGQDIHTATAARVFDVPYDEVTRENRYKAKTVNFAIVYGAGSNRLTQELEISHADAKKLIANYFENYEGLRTYMDSVVEQARKDGFVTTKLGRRRYLRDIDSRNVNIRKHAERNAVNTPIQGTAADMIKLAMINVHRAFQEHKFESKLILQVHDELVFDVVRSELEAVTKVVEKEMREALPGLSVPIVVESDTGEHWLDAH